MELKIGDPIDSSIAYYRLYKSNRDSLMHVICMQDFDEVDYYQGNFVRNKNGEKYYFENENDAIKQLNLWFNPIYIASEFRLDKNINDLIR
jgi:hypothetical protein